MDIFQLLMLSLFTLSLGWNTYRHIKSAIEIKKVLSKSSPDDIKGTFYSQIFRSVISLVMFVVLLNTLVNDGAAFFKNFGPDTMTQLGMAAGFLVFGFIFFYFFFKWVKKQEENDKR